MNSMIDEILNQKRFSVIVKPNSKKNEITGIEKGALKVNIAAPAEKNKANLEVIKFFSKKLKKKAFIVSGLTSRNKIIGVK